MNLISRRLSVFALGVAALLIVTHSAEAQPIRVTTQTVPLYVTVTDQEKRLVPDLTREDFEVYDNGKLQTLTTFDNEPTPITVVVMLDTSGSMTLALDLVKAAAEQFLIRLMPDDQAMIGAFNDKIELHPEGFTNMRDDLVHALRDLDFGYPTRLYDAVDESLERLEPVEGRKVVLVFTDGDDTSSKVNVGKVMDRAREKDVMVYAIGLVNDYFNGQQRVRSQPDRGLKKLAEDTGGGYFEFKRSADLGQTFTRVAQELHSQYVLGFSPETTDGKIHKLEVRVKKTGMNARARKTYMAPLAGTK